jgi:vacuolar-type H+-ATPase subunit H
VPAVRDLLERFRPAGAPGAATAAGVPADRRATVEAELEPIFGALDEVTRQGEETRLTASRAADHRLADAQQQARAIVARAATEAEAERAAAAAQLRSRAAREVAEIAAGAAAAAHAVRRDGEQTHPQLLVRVVERVRVELAAVGLNAAQRPNGSAGRSGESA